MVTAAPGTVINGGAFTVPPALGNRIIHPYSDFLLHNIGTGDGIPFLPTPEYAFTAPLIRTAPLWALRTRNRLMHDGLSFTLQDAIQRHAGHAAARPPPTTHFRPSRRINCWRFCIHSDDVRIEKWALLKFGSLEKWEGEARYGRKTTIRRLRR
jgi:hypothetical protein